MTKSQDTKILLYLIEFDKSTAYAISQGTGISIPQITYRINKLIDSGIISSVVEDNKTYYNVHPALKSNEIISEITGLMKKVCDVIDRAKYTKPSGMKSIIELIISRLELSEPNDEEIV